MYLLNTATRRLHNDGKVLSVLIVTFQNMPNFSSSDSDYIITDPKVSESESEQVMMSPNRLWKVVTGIRLLILTRGQAKLF
jgi:hypothetical protein